MEDWVRDGGPELWHRCSKELKQMPRLRTIRIAPRRLSGTLFYRDNTDKEAWENFYIVLSVPTLRCLHLCGIPLDWATKLEHMPDIFISPKVYILQNSSEQPISSQVRGLRVLCHVRIPA